MKEDLKGFEEDLAAAKAVTPAYDTYRRLQNSEIPRLEKEINSITVKLAEGNKGLDQRTRAVGELKAEMKSLEGLKRPVQDSTRYTKEIEDLSREIILCENSLGGSGGSLSGAEIRAKMDSLNEQRGKLQREQKAVTVEKEKSRIRIQGIKDQIASIRIRIGEGENKVNAKETIMKDLAEAKNRLRHANEDITVGATRKRANTRLQQRKSSPWIPNSPKF